MPFSGAASAVDPSPLILDCRRDIASHWRQLVSGQGSFVSDDFSDHHLPPPAADQTASSTGPHWRRVGGGVGLLPDANADAQDVRSSDLAVDQIAADYVKTGKYDVVESELNDEVPEESGSLEDTEQLAYSEGSPTSKLLVKASRPRSPAGSNSFRSRGEVGGRVSKTWRKASDTVDLSREALTAASPMKGRSSSSSSTHGSEVEAFEARYRLVYSCVVENYGERLAIDLFRQCGV